jgi:hypothetical protein
MPLAQYEEDPGIGVRDGRPPHGRSHENDTSSLNEQRHKAYLRECGPCKVCQEFLFFPQK